MNVAAIIQARVGSTRLPNKVLKEIAGRTVLEHVINRVKAASKIDDIIVATTVNKEDRKIVKICNDLGCSVFCGSEEDVLDRYYQAAKSFKVRHIVRITADCPLIDSSIIDEVVGKHLKEQADYTANVIKETYPDGLDVEVFTFNSLKKAFMNAQLLSEREHITPYIRKHREVFKIVNVEYSENLSDKRWTLDEEADYQFIKYVYKGLFNKNPLFGMKEIIEFLKENPEIEKLNMHISRNEGYKKSLKEDGIIDLKDQKE